MNTWRRDSHEDGDDDEVDDGGEHPVLELEVLEDRSSRFLHQSGAEDLFRFGKKR